MPSLELIFQTESGQVMVLDYAWTYGLTVDALLKASEVLQHYPELQGRSIGIFGRLVSGESLLQPGDRVEIYSPLKIDPKTARRSKAKKKAGS